jgi:hypothetical protein
MSLQKVRKAFAANRWLRWQACLTLLLVANGIRLIVTWPGPKTWWSDLAAPILLVPFFVCMALTFRLSDQQRRQREAAVAEARVLRTPRAPNAGPDQCPVCGGFGLTDLAADDAFMERGPDRAKVVAWGSRRAHRDCAEMSPYVPTAEEKARDTHFREHGQAARVRTCDWCFTEDIRWEQTEARRAFERSQPELMESAAAGDRRIRLNRQPDPQFRHWLINPGAPTRHMDILIVESCEKAADGFGVVATLAEPLRHGLFAVRNLTGQQLQRMMPLDSARLWNGEAGRPFTRAELGLCDCGEAVVGGKLRASIDPQPFRWRGMDVEAREAALAPCRLATDAATVAALFAEAYSRPQHMATAYKLSDRRRRS